MEPALLGALSAHAGNRPAAPALRQGEYVLSYRELLEEIERVQGRLRGERFGLLLANHPAWAVLDLALLRGGKLCVPLPPFFSAVQLRHSIADAGLDTLVTDQPQVVTELCGLQPERSVWVAGRGLAVFRLDPKVRPELPSGVVKVTYTSGTTGNPKGVCLTWDAIQPVVDALRAAGEVDQSDVALTLLPLSTLLENIGSLYVPLQAGALAALPSPAETGLRGAAGLDSRRLLDCLGRYQPTGVILIPQLLQALVEAVEAGLPLPKSLRFAAVGGAPVARRLMVRAQAVGLPVYQGYGLSEAASVVALNRPGRNRPGSVGRPLPHLRLRIAGDGEVLVAGTLFSGYLGETGPDLGRGPLQDWATGDLGYLDSDGYLYLTGRKRHVFITSFGRNVAPEWVECELQAQPAIAQSAVFGEARAFNVAVIVPRPGYTPSAVERAVAAVNASLPDYARVHRYLLTGQPFSTDNGLLTGTGRVRRERVDQHYRQALEAFYQ